MKLTVDKNGKDATDPAFDPANIEQWGFESQFMDNYNLRAESAWFGTGPPSTAPARRRSRPR